VTGAVTTAASLGSAFDDYIVDAGKLPAFLFLVSFLGMFAFIRTSAHMIRAEVSWWPGNVEVGGTHIHHLVWGIIVLMISGWIAIAVDPGSPGRELAAVAFGIGTGLTLDEFALWLELKDVYWEEEGRKSIDAVIVAGILAGFGVLGLSIWIDAANDVEAAVHATVGFWGLLGLALAAINFLKEKFVMGVMGFFLWPVALVGAVRLGRPGSPWSRRFYGEEKRARAHERFGDGVRPSLPHRAGRSDQG
jgi:hypothetical protein